MDLNTNDLTPAPWPVLASHCPPHMLTGATKPLTVKSAPIGTKAPACIGGYWTKTERGWKWCTGSTFPRPGGDWTGELIPPEPAA